MPVVMASALIHRSVRLSLPQLYLAKSVPGCRLRAAQGQSYLEYPSSQPVQQLRVSVALHNHRDVLEICMPIVAGGRAGP